jgi:hypothetical protein
MRYGNTAASISKPQMHISGVDNATTPHTALKLSDARALSHGEDTVWREAVITCLYGDL